MTRTEHLAALLLLVSFSPASFAQSGSAFCFGDGTGTPCPCSSNGNSGEGCANTGGAGGATLSGAGLAQTLNDTFQLNIVGVPGSKPGLILRGANQLNGGLGNPVADGLLCVSGQSARSQVQLTTSGFTIFLDFQGQGFGASNYGLGVPTNYVFWYRDPQNTCSGSGFNFSNAWTVTWELGVSPAYDGMAPIPGGSFSMGRHAGDGFANELPLHDVTLGAFYMDTHEVTNQKYADYLNAAHALGQVTVTAGIVYQVGGAGQLLCVTSASPGSYLTWDGALFGSLAGKANFPMLEVSWYGACAYSNERSRQAGLVPCYDESSWNCNFNASGYRLPTEAEWEYAARGGEHHPYQMYSWGSFINGSHANYFGSGDPYEAGAFPYPTPVGFYDGDQTPSGADRANGYGLYDMSGNVLEWCFDRFSGSYYSSSPSNNPTGPGSSTFRVFRGGSWFNGSQDLRSANRGHGLPVGWNHHLGFRVVAIQP